MIAFAPDRTSVTAPGHAGIARLVRALDEIASAAIIAPAAVYAPRDGAETIGRHVAGVLDLVERWLDGLRLRVMRDEAGTRVSTHASDRGAAVRSARDLTRAVLEVPERSLDRGVRVEHAGWDGDVECSWSTVANELAFVLGRIAAAQRTIGDVMARAGVPLPEGFGSMPLLALSARRPAPPAGALARLLDELSALLVTIPADVYHARPDTDVSGTIGEHVRHCLDHVSALLAADPAMPLSYDRRTRGTAIEIDASAALQHILRLKAAVDRWAARPLDEPIRVTSMISPSGESVTGWSTLARELAFVLSHTIHHQATIAMLLTLHGIDVPNRFGHSPSTPARS